MLTTAPGPHVRRLFPNPRSIVLVFYMLLLFLLLGPLLLGRAVRRLGSTERLMLPGARHAEGWDLEALKAYPERVEQLRGWVDRILLTWAPIDDLPRHRLESGYLNPHGPQSAPPVFQVTFRDVNGDLIHLGASHIYEAMAQDARWLAAVLHVPLEDDVAEGRPARIHAQRALPAPGGSVSAPPAAQPVHGAVQGFSAPGPPSHSGYGGVPQGPGTPMAPPSGRGSPYSEGPGSGSDPSWTPGRGRH